MIYNPASRLLFGFKICWDYFAETSLNRSSQSEYNHLDFSDSVKFKCIQRWKNVLCVGGCAPKQQQFQATQASALPRSASKTTIDCEQAKLNVDDW